MDGIITISYSLLSELIEQAYLEGIKTAKELIGIGEKGSKGLGEKMCERLRAEQEKKGLEEQP
jgi:hypothetical protein